MSKEACCFILDVRRSMDNIVDPNNELTRIDASKKIIKMVLQQKMLFSTSDEVAVVLLGTREAKNECYNSVQGRRFHNITVFRGFHQTNVKTMQDVETDIDVENAPSEGDLFESLFVADSLIEEKVGKKKYTRKIYLITDRTSAPISPNNLQCHIAQALQANNVKVNVIFAGNAEDINVKREPGVEPTENESGESAVPSDLVALAETCGGESFSYSEFSSLLSRPSSKHYALRYLSASLFLSKTIPDASEEVALRSEMDDNTDPVASLYPLISIPVSFSSHTLKEKFPSASSEFYDASQAMSGEESGLSGCVDDLIPNRIYTDPSHPDDEVPPEDIVTGYKYGLDFVPISPEEQASMAVTKSPAAFELISFVPRSSLPFDDFVGGVNVVLPATGGTSSSRGFVAYSHLIDAMMQLDVVALVRFSRNASANPKLCALFPDVYLIPPSDPAIAEDDASYKDDPLNYRRMLYAITMGFEDGRKHYSFPAVCDSPLNPEVFSQQSKNFAKNQLVCSTEDITAVENMVNALDFDALAMSSQSADQDMVDSHDSNPNNSNSKSLFEEISDLYNPSLWRLHEAICFRALMPNEPLPLKEDLNMVRFRETMYESYSIDHSTIHPTQQGESHQASLVYGLPKALKDPITAFAQACPVSKIVEVQDSKGRKKKTKKHWRDFFPEATEAQSSSLDLEMHEREREPSESLLQPTSTSSQPLAPGSFTGSAVKTEPDQVSEESLTSVLQGLKEELLSPSMFHGLATGAAESDGLSSSAVASLDRTRSVGTANPAQDINTLFQYLNQARSTKASKSPDYDGPNVDDILEQGFGMVFRLLESTMAGLSISKCIECVRTLRYHALKEAKPAHYNDFLDDLRKKFSDDGISQSNSNSMSSFGRDMYSSASPSSLTVGNQFWKELVAESTKSMEMVAEQGKLQNYLVHPIDMNECSESNVIPQDALKYFQPRTISSLKSSTIPSFQAPIVAEKTENDDDFGFGDLE